MISLQESRCTDEHIHNHKYYYPGWPWMASHKKFKYYAFLVQTGSSYLKLLLTKSQMPEI